MHLFADEAFTCMRAAPRASSLIWKKEVVFVFFGLVNSPKKTDCGFSHCNNSKMEPPNWGEQINHCLILIAGMNGLFSLACVVLWARANCLLWELKQGVVSSIVSTTGDGLSSGVSDLRLSVDVTSLSRRVSRSHDMPHPELLREEILTIIRINVFIVLITSICLTVLSSVEAFTNVCYWTARFLFLEKRFLSNVHSFSLSLF